MASRPLSRKAMAEALETWNATHPEGTAIAMRILKGGPWYASVTRSAAFALGDGTPVVMVEGRSGGWALSSVRPLKAGETLPALPPREVPRA